MSLGFPQFDGFSSSEPIGDEDEIRFLVLTRYGYGNK